MATRLTVETEKRILKAALDNPDITLERIGKRFGVGDGVVSRILREAGVDTVQRRKDYAFHVRGL